MTTDEIIRCIAFLLFTILVIVYPFAVMGPTRPRHTWWAVAMGELFGLGGVCSMVVRFHEPVRWPLYFSIFGAVCGLVFSFLSYRIYGGMNRRGR
jgi:hypothetical protein